MSGVRATGYEFEGGGRIELIDGWLHVDHAPDKPAVELRPEMVSWILKLLNEHDVKEPDHA